MENVKALLLSWEDGYAASSKPQACLLISAWISSPFNMSARTSKPATAIFKKLLGFDQYQLLSFKGIQRFWAIQFLTQNFLESQRQDWIKRDKRLTLEMWCIEFGKSILANHRVCVPTSLG